MRIQIISPKRIVFDGECTMVEYNTSEGYVGVFPGHVAMTQVLAPGIFRVYEEGKEKPFTGVIHSGLATIMPDLVTLLPEVVELKGEIDVERANIAKKKAEKNIVEKAEGYDWQKEKLALDRANVRLELEKE